MWMKIEDYPSVETIEDNDILIINTGDGTKSTSAQKLSNFIKGEGYEPWVAHRNTCRGKNLGSEFTDEQKIAIRTGTFNDLYVGDYWEIGGVKWRIADINYWLKTGDTPANTGCTTPHLVILPDTTIINNVLMNSTNVTTGGYVGSDMYKTKLASVKQIVFSVFGQNNILNHREFLENAVTNGYVSGRSWYDSNVELPSQIMMFGSNIYPQTSGTVVANNATINTSQLALFQMRPDLIIISSNHYWLRDVVAASGFATVAWAGHAGSSGASYSGMGVRPVFGIIG